MQFDQLDLAEDLGLQLVRKRTTVPCASRVEQLPAVLMQWIEVPDALSGEQTLDAVRVRDPLPPQYRALAAYPPTVFLFRRGRHDHRTDTRFSARPRQQRSQKCLAVDRIRLGAPPAPRRGGGRRIEQKNFNTVFT